MSENESANAGAASRRALVGGFLGLGVGVPLLAACGSDSKSDSSAATTSPPGPVGKKAEVPVGGAKIFAAEEVMVSQPAAGDFKAFSTICTHRQCRITKLEGDFIECPCHRSRFSIDDGSVVRGPATKPLTELKVTLKGDDLVVS